MKRSLSPTTFFDTVAFAYEHDNDQLKQHIIDFMRDGQNEKAVLTLIASHAWKCLVVKNGQIVEDITEGVLLNQ